MASVEARTGTEAIRLRLGFRSRLRNRDSLLLRSRSPNVANSSRSYRDRPDCLLSIYISREHSCSPGAQFERSRGTHDSLDRVVQGSQRNDGIVAKVVDSGKETRQFFYAEFSRPFAAWQTWQSGQLSKSSTQTGNQIGFVSDFAPSAGDQIEVKVGWSYISAEQARRNIQARNVVEIRPGEGGYQGCLES